MSTQKNVRSFKCLIKRETRVGNTSHVHVQAQCKNVCSFCVKIKIKILNDNEL